MSFLAPIFGFSVRQKTCRKANAAKRAKSQHTKGYTFVFGRKDERWLRRCRFEHFEWIAVKKIAIYARNEFDEMLAG